MAKHWRIHAHDPDQVAAVQRATGVPAVVAGLLIGREITEPDRVRAFLDPKLSDLREPQLLPGLSRAVEQIYQAVRARSPIAVYGDYDVDGITGTALLWMCLKLLGAQAAYYVPHRVEEGYGLNGEAIRKLAAEGNRVIVTVDCGIASEEEAALARRLGVQLIITDHHQPPLALPAAESIVHPALPGSSYPFAGLSGAGVALKLAWGLCQQASGAKKVSSRMRHFLLQAVGLAALGTVADVVPLVDENRVLVCHGLRSLAAEPTVGLAALMRTAQLDQKQQLDSEDLAFALAPRLNAAGRLGQPRLAVELLLTDRPDRADELAHYLDHLNTQRQHLERVIYRAAHKQAKEQFDPHHDPALVLADHQWHEGVIGIVAGRLAERYHCPVVLICWDKLGVRPGVGSARSVPGFDLHAALQACADHLLGYGGHAAAAGLKIDEEALELFRAAFCEFAAEQISQKQRDAELQIDVEAPLSAFTLETVGQIERLAPFGHGNERPVVCTTNVTLAEAPRAIGSGGNHLALKLSQHGVTLRAVAFGGAHWAEQLQSLDRPFDAAFRPVINTFRGRRSVELQLVDWR